MTANRIAIRTRDGEPFEVVTDLPAEVYIVDESCPADRVYLLSNMHRCEPGAVAKLIGSSPIGHAADGVIPGQERKQ